jgi:hypothetical protein
LLFTVVGVITAIVLFCGYSYFLAGPHLRITSRGGRAEIDTQFLGEYDLGLERLVITDGDSETVVLDLESAGPNIEGVFYLMSGANRIDDLDRGRSGVTRRVPKGAKEFDLAAHHPYRVRVCGNNGSGYVRCSTGGFTL